VPIVRRTPVQIQKFCDDYGHVMDFPAPLVYGDEPNTFGKPWEGTDLHFAVYSVADYIQFVANQTVPLLYEMANEAAPEILGDRCFFPSTRKELALFKRQGIPIYGCETKQPLGAFDVFGMSSSYGAFYLNLIQGMRMSGIPFRWEDRVDRKEEYPLVMMGGMGSYVPTSYDPVVDLVFVGEAEDEPGNPGYMALLREFADYKRAGYFERGHPDRWEEMLHDLCRRYTFLYRPAYYEPQYDDKTWHKSQWVVKYDDLPKRPRKRFAVNLDQTFHLKKKPVPWYDTGMGLGELEISRGCQASCLFCAEGYRYRPYRERSVEYLVGAFKELVALQGSDRAFPAAFEFSGYTKKKELVRRLLAEVSDNVDTQSQRVDNFARDPNFGMAMAALGGMKNLTIAIEGNSQRMRDVISKGCTEKEILQVFEIAFRSGYDRIKAFVICDLPGETEADTREIIDLARKVIDLRNAYGRATKILFSWTPLFVEGWVPFQWAQSSINDKAEAMGAVVGELSRLGIGCSLGHKASSGNYIWNQIFALADRVAAEALLATAIKTEAVFFTNVTNDVATVLEEELEKRGRSLEFYFREKPDDTIFPWDFLLVGVGKAALLRYWRKAKEYLAQTDMLPGGHLIAKCDMDCITCGACAGDLPEILQEGRAADTVTDISKALVIDQRTLAQRVLLRIRVDPKRRFVGQDHWGLQLRRAAYLNDWPITKRHIRFQDEQGRNKKWLSGVDYVEVGFTKRFYRKADRSTFIARLNEHLNGFEVLDAKEVPINDNSGKDVGDSLWKMEIDRQDVFDVVGRFNDAKYWPVILYEDRFREGMVRVEYNAKDFVHDLWVRKEGASYYLVMQIAKKLTPYDVHKCLFGSKNEEAHRYPAIRLEAFQPGGRSDDLFAVVCEVCERNLPHDFWGNVYRSLDDRDLCPRCADHAIRTAVIEGTIPTRTQYVPDMAGTAEEPEEALNVLFDKRVGVHSDAE